MRTIPGIEVFVKRLDDVITNNFIRSLFNRSCTDLERELFSLPVRLGGLGLKVPSEMCKIQYKNSCEITAKLVKQVKEQESILEVDKPRMNEIKAKIRVEKEARNERKVESIRQRFDESKRKLFDATSEHGASHWLN